MSITKLPPPQARLGLKGGLTATQVTKGLEKKPVLSLEHERVHALCC